MSVIASRLLISSDSEKNQELFCLLIFLFLGLLLLIFETLPPNFITSEEGGSFSYEIIE